MRQGQILVGQQRQATAQDMRLDQKPLLCSKSLFNLRGAGVVGVTVGPV
jgi:hypothetical protein